MLIAIQSSVAQAQTTQPGWTPLFNGKDLTGFYTIVGGGVGKNTDPDGYFKVEDGMIHILGLAATEAQKPWGYIATEKVYDNYHLRAQFKWGTKKFTPRTNQPRDSGILYHMNGPDMKTSDWPQSIEFQVQENDVGEMIIVGKNVEVTVPIKQIGNRRTYDPAGEPTKVTQGRVYKQPVADKLDDWNTIDLWCKGNQSVHIVNGTWMMNLTAMRYTDTDKPMASGHILFQAEGAEIFYKNIEIHQLGADEQLPKPPTTSEGN